MHKRFIQETIAALYPDVSFQVLTPPDPQLGDYSVNLAFALAKKEHKNPAAVATELATLFSKEFSEMDWDIRAAGPFVNFYMQPKFLQKNLEQILREGAAYGASPKKDEKINLEFVSANPTGPPTVGNARAGSYGDTLGNILRKAGYEVGKEYYINDVGNQVKKLAQSVVNSFLEQEGKDPIFPGEDLYKGAYIADVAREVAKRIGKPLDAVDIQDVQDVAIAINIQHAQTSVAALGITYDTWFKESTLHINKEVEETLSLLREAEVVFEKDGATWLKFGEQEDDVAVLVKSDGSTSYLMNDIAYTRNKFSRGFDIALNIWGTDHHGDVPRLKGGVAALGYATERLKIFLHQLVALRKNGELVRMSKRAGNIETLDALLSEVGKDAVRYFFLAKDLNTHMEFDIDLAKEQSKKNPVYYIQYAGARLHSIFEKAGREYDPTTVGALSAKEEIELLRVLAKFPDVIQEISQTYHVHHLAQYTTELATLFHKFYETQRVIQDNAELQQARVTLACGVETVLRECLSLMGISMPERMERIVDDSAGDIEA